MGWANIDLAIDPIIFDFQTDANLIALEVYKNGKLKLDEKDKEKSTQLHNTRPRTQEEAQDFAYQRQWEEELHQDRVNSLGLFVLVYISSALERTLDGLKKPFDKSHPAPRQIQGDSKLLRRKDEYLKRFKIDFGKAPVSFVRIQEIVLARNAGVHNDIRTYQGEIPDPRFIDNVRRKFCASERDLQLAGSDAVRFVEWLGDQLKNLRRSAHTA